MNDFIILLDPKNMGVGGLCLFGQKLPYILDTKTMKKVPVIFTFFWFSEKDKGATTSYPFFYAHTDDIN